MVTPSTRASYRGAAAHYLSSDRRDPVKVLWEEPVSRRIFRDAVAQLDRPAGPLRVLDVGSGTGDGVELLRSALSPGTGAPPAIDYVGLDLDPEMVATAESGYADDDEVRFVTGDVRSFEFAESFDLYLSTGVPYSHLTVPELTDAVASIFENVPRGRDAAVIIDVLGRYSLEWTERWDAQRWTYSMSFFSDVSEEITCEMTVHTRDSLSRCVDDAARRTGTTLARSAFHDRSIGVGRHSTTGRFNAGWPHFRTLVNDLHRGNTEIDPAELHMPAMPAAAPAEVTEFLQEYRSAWNAAIDACRAAEAADGRSAASRGALAEQLRSCETRRQRGLGVGHSLIGVFHVRR